MIRLEADNRFVYIRGAGRKTMRRLEKATSYLVAGFMFSPAFRKKVWDGREHLLKYKAGAGGGYRVPLGMLGDLIKTLEFWEKPFKLDNSGRRSPKSKVKYSWNDSIVMRDYQEAAVEAILAKGDINAWHYGSGIIKMPIRSGKTKTAARLINRLGVRALFIVPSQMLLHQTRAALEDALVMKVGSIGDSEWNEADVTVATIQSIAAARGSKTLAKRKLYKALSQNYDLIIWDEAHHLRGEVNHAVMLAFDAPYKVGLSATVYFDNDRETEKGVIWLKACCGDIKIDIPTSKLIREGHLMQPDVLLYRVDKPNLLRARWSKTLQNMAVYENEHRNQLIIRLAAEQLDAGLNVLIVTNRKNQAALLSDELDSRAIKHRVITGEDGKEDRADKASDFAAGRVKVLIGTVFGEGVDIPSIECVINAEGGRDLKATVQRMRNLTPSSGKTQAVFIDFIDVTNGYFAEHSKERIAAYRSEDAFKVRIAK